MINDLSFVFGFLTASFLFGVLLILYQDYLTKQKPTIVNNSVNKPKIKDILLNDLGITPETRKALIGWPNGVDQYQSIHSAGYQVADGPDAYSITVLHLGNPVAHYWPKTQWFNLIGTLYEGKKGRGIQLMLEVL